MLGSSLTTYSSRSTPCLTVPATDTAYDLYDSRTLDNKVKTPSPISLLCLSWTGVPYSARTEPSSLYSSECPMAPSASAARACSTTASSNWEPAFLPNSSITVSVGSALRYDRVDVIASNASATDTIFDNSEKCRIVHPSDCAPPLIAATWNALASPLKLKDRAIEIT